MTTTILLLGTFDSKLPELKYTHSQLQQCNNTNILTLDLGRIPTSDPEITIPAQDNTHLSRADYINAAVAHSTPLAARLFASGKIHGAVGIGGSCGTALATGVMRGAFPVGFPKMMVSTMASGDVRPYIEETDITIMYSVVDVAGGNCILNGILGNASAGIVGMAGAYAARLKKEEQGGGKGERKKRSVGVSMFGVTTPCADRVREILEDEEKGGGYEVYVFHATGAGGKAMERLIAEGQIDAVVDLTTTEVVDELVGGVLTAGPNRLEAAAKMGIPQVVSVGACDMVNFGPLETLPSQLRERLVHRHNPMVTLVRTSPAECRQIAQFIAHKLRAFSTRPDLIRVLLPAGGISMIDLSGQPFHDPEADEVLFSTLEKELQGSGISVRRDEHDINSPKFAMSAAESLVELIRVCT